MIAAGMAHSSVRACRETVLEWELPRRVYVVARVDGMQRQTDGYRSRWGLGMATKVAVARDQGRWRLNPVASLARA